MEKKLKKSHGTLQINFKFNIMPYES